MKGFPERWIIVLPRCSAQESGTGARQAQSTCRAFSPRNVQELLDHGANVVVLSRGMAECLQVPRETIDFLKERRIEAHILPTTQAAELYNQLAKEGPVGGLFHTTC